MGGAKSFPMKCFLYLLLCKRSCYLPYFECYFYEKNKTKPGLKEAILICMLFPCFIWWYVIPPFRYLNLLYYDWKWTTCVKRKYYLVDDSRRPSNKNKTHSEKCFCWFEGVLRYVSNASAKSSFIYGRPQQYWGQKGWIKLLSNLDIPA